MHDVLIVGGGISGLSCATFLAQKGLDVLVLEKSSAIGGHLKENLQGFLFYELDKIDIEIPTDMPVKKLCIWSPDKEKTELNFDEAFLYLVKRSGGNDSFDSYLANKAIAAGAQIRLGSKVIGVIRNNGAFEGVQTSQGEIFRGRYIVASDGATSRMRKIAGIDTLSIRGRGYGLKMHNVNVDALSVHVIFDTDVTAMGYGYVIGYPDGKHATVAIATRSRYMKRSLKGYFEVFKSFVEPLLKEATEIQSFSGVVTCGDGTQEVVKDNMIFIGEAGGFQDPMFGFGMAPCIRSAKLCADVIVKSWEEKNLLTLREFDREAKERLVKREILTKRKARGLIFDRMNNRDFAAFIPALQGSERLLMNALEGGDWREIIYHNIPKAILRRPALLRLLPHIPSLYLSSRR